MRGVWHYARVSAFIVKNQRPDAQKELALLKTIVSDPELPAEPASFSVNGLVALRPRAGAESSEKRR